MALNYCGRRCITHLLLEKKPTRGEGPVVGALRNLGACVRAMQLLGKAESLQRSLIPLSVVSGFHGFVWNMFERAKMFGGFLSLLTVLKMGTWGMLIMR